MFKVYFLYFTVFVTGAAVLVIEILGSRVLAPFYGSTIFVWSSLITVTLGALALGYFVGGHFADRYPRGQIFYGIIFVAGLLTALLVKISEQVLLWSDRFGFQWGPLAATLALFSLPLFFFGMVTPFAIRLRALSLEHTGHTSGTVFGLSTVGSLVGAVIAGFYLLPNFFVASTIFALSAGVMAVAIAGLVLSRAGWRRVLPAAALLVIQFFLPAFGAQNSKDITVLYHEPSFYGDIQIVTRTGDLRCLVVDSQGQSCVMRDGSQAFPYGRMIVDILSTKNRDSESGSALVVGFAGGVITRDLGKYFKNIDAVEVDAKMLLAAENLIGYRQAEPETNVIIADGRRFLRKNIQKYDAVVLDAFSGLIPAGHLYTIEAFADIKRALAPEGLVVVNTIGYTSGPRAELQRSVFKTLREVFPYIVAASPDEAGSESLTNVIFAASDKEIVPLVGPEFLVEYNDNELALAGTLTDARNPIIILGVPIFRESRNVYQRFLGNL